MANSMEGKTAKIFTHSPWGQRYWWCIKQLGFLVVLGHCQAFFPLFFWQKQFLLAKSPWNFLNSNHLSPLNVLQKTIAVHDSSGPRVQSECKKILRNHPSNFFALPPLPSLYSTTPHISLPVPLLPSLCSIITPIYFFSPFPSFQVPQLFQFHQQPEQSLCKHFVPYFKQNYYT